MKFVWGLRVIHAKIVEIKSTLKLIVMWMGNQWSWMEVGALFCLSPQSWGWKQWCLPSAAVQKVIISWKLGEEFKNRCTDFHSVTCVDHRWGILFILVPLSGKIPKAAESSKLCLPSGKQKCSLHMHIGLLDGCKKVIFLKIQSRCWCQHIPEQAHIKRKLRIRCYSKVANEGNLSSDLWVKINE